MIKIVKRSSILILIFIARTGIEAMINQKAVDLLLKKAASSHTDEMVVIHNGKKICEYYSNDPNVLIKTMSVTKSIVSLGFGILVTQKKLDTIDKTIYTWYPEWKQGKKQLVMVRNLLNHTSGIQDQADFHIEIYQAPDFVKLAIAADLLTEPGANFSYSNKASNLLSGIFEQIAKQPMDIFLANNLFKPLGITNYTWDHDKAGNVYGLGGLALNVQDLSKIGQLVIDKGAWQGKQIIDPQWIAMSLDQSQEHNPLYGLMWWRIPENISFVIDDTQLKKLKEAKVDDLFIELVASMKGNYHTEMDYNKTLESKFGKDWEKVLKEKVPGFKTLLARAIYGKMIGYCAEGWLGQYLVIFPEKNLIGVRLIKERPNYNKKTDWFKEFQAMVNDIVQ